MSLHLQVLSATLNGFINCSCNHLTSFGGSLLVKPNPIDFDKVLVEFKKLPETGNTAVIVTVAIVFMCYIIALVIFRKTDKQDSRHVSITMPIYLVIPVPFHPAPTPPRPALSYPGLFWSVSCVLFCSQCFVTVDAFDMTTLSSDAIF